MTDQNNGRIRVFTHNRNGKKVKLLLLLLLLRGSCEMHEQMRK